MLVKGATGQVCELTKHTSYLTLTVKLWAVYCGEYWPYYNSTIQYITITCSHQTPQQLHGGVSHFCMLKSHMVIVHNTHQSIWWVIIPKLANIHHMRSSGSGLSVAVMPLSPERGTTGRRYGLHCMTPVGVLQEDIVERKVDSFLQDLDGFVDNFKGVYRMKASG